MTESRRRHLREGLHLLVAGSLTLLTACVVLGVTRGEGGAIPGSSPAAVYNQANDLYAQGKYAEALELYEDLVQTGVSNGFLFYNLGNACFKQGEIGKAILWYSRAGELLPRDRDIAINLEFARKVRPDKIDQAFLPPAFRAIRTAVLGLNLSELTLVVFALYIFAVVSLILFIVAKPAQLRRVTARSSLVLAGLLLLSLLWLGGRIHRGNRILDCVVMARQVNAMSGPGEDYTRVMSVHEGTEAAIVEEREGWYLIKLPSGLGGWIPARSAETI